jgi:hypothetical protein
MENSQLQLIAQAMENPESRELIKTFIQKQCSKKVSTVMIKMLDNPDGVNEELFKEYAQIIKEEYTDVALDQYSSGEISKEELEERIKDLEFDYFEMLSQQGID